MVVDILLREHRDTASAEAFFRQAVERTRLHTEYLTLSDEEARALMQLVPE